MLNKKYTCSNIKNEKGKCIRHNYISQAGNNNFITLFMYKQNLCEKELYVNTKINLQIYTDT